MNNAGVYSFSPLEAVTEEEISRIFATNVTGLLLTTKAAVPLFPAEGGSVINIGSVVSENSTAQHVHLHRKQRCSRRHHSRSRQGTRSEENSCQRRKPRHYHHRRHEQRGNRGLRLRNPTRHADPSGSHWQARSISQTSSPSSPASGRGSLGHGVVAPGGRRSSLTEFVHRVFTSPAETSAPQFGSHPHTRSSCRVRGRAQATRRRP